MFEVLAAWGQGCAACASYISSHRRGLEGRLCGRCREDLPKVLQRMASPEHVYASWTLGDYAGLLGGLVRSAKYGGREDVLYELGQYLAERIVQKPLPYAFDAIARVPGSYGRNVERGFDAVEILARPVALAVGLPVVPVLARRAGAPQAGQTRRDRASNVRGAFTARGRAEGHWLLIDDVMTTGATAAAAALALREAGAKSVSLLVVAATNQPRNVPVS